MTNHPNRSKRTYWTRSPRNFGNEYTVAAATTREHAASYRDAGYERLNRESALRQMTYRGDAATQAYVDAECDGYPWDRFELARAIRTGEL